MSVLGYSCFCLRQAHPLSPAFDVGVFMRMRLRDESDDMRGSTHAEKLPPARSAHSAHVRLDEDEPVELVEEPPEEPPRKQPQAPPRARKPPAPSVPEPAARFNPRQRAARAPPAPSVPEPAARLNPRQRAARAQAQQVSRSHHLQAGVVLDDDRDEDQDWEDMATGSTTPSPPFSRSPARAERAHSPVFEF
ncbi:hypothetical protein EMIHUDRAFT_436828 [Emiliania huxleyi CCMP1516]|uniref:Uncharacterized protein n=2 Tax=Emiliania huxleyi TaxID=2903 RepID=A0A0D3IVY2_EMIH1|nr:hypothetical protein EMIHUDRAFT_436828 [Emiliania huxleyi CCMP1516]EOD15417.1 hypothetical protein EMIHUDRAFT_436828 [Emiliania huxleyi CCMP1516]|eukprot:XP_005767846.1 hypothetical protein EMIHUDRAFT_436828 [Emiliania huxleyi CCMP1516]